MNEDFLEKRVAWVDALKTLGILLVVLGHFGSPFTQFIYSFHMPLFFIMSGFFLKSDRLIKPFIIKDLKRLMLPYVIFAIAGLGVEIIKRALLHRPSLDYASKLINIFYKMDVSALIHTYGLILWFLPALFFGRLFLFLLLKFVRNDLFIFLSAVGLFILSFYVDLPFGIDNGMNAVLWLFLGNVFFRKLQEASVLSVLLPLMLGLSVFFPVPSADVASKYYSKPILNILWASSIVYMLIVFFKSFHYKDYITKTLSKWGESALILFAFHPYTNNAAELIVKKIGFGDWYLKLLLSLLMLQALLSVKSLLQEKGMWRYSWL